MGAEIGYREEIFHPSMTAPVTARGWFERGDDGTLIRHQTEPQRETVKIGEDVIFVHREADGFRNILPIPAEMAPLLAALRSVVALRGSGDSSFPRRYARDIANGPAGWTLTLTPKGAGDDIARGLALSGCGGMLQAIELRLHHGQRRKYVFEPAP